MLPQLTSLYLDDPIYHVFQLNSSILVALFTWITQAYAATVEISRQSNCIWITIDAPIRHIRIIVEITANGVQVIAKTHESIESAKVFRNYLRCPLYDSNDIEVP